MSYSQQADVGSNMLLEVPEMGLIPYVQLCSWIGKPIHSGTTAPPKREQIAMWAVEEFHIFSQQTVQNAWRHSRFGWFPEEL